MAHACHHIIEEHCNEDTGGAKGDEGQVMKCLVEFKLSHANEVDRMNEKCEAAVEHWQIFALRDWQISASFKQACSKDVRNLCTK